MLTKSILTAAAFALAAGLGSASYAGQFVLLDNIPAQAISAVDLAEIIGKTDIHVHPLGSVLHLQITSAGHGGGGLLKAVTASPVITNN